MPRGGDGFDAGDRPAGSATISSPSMVSLEPSLPPRIWITAMALAAVVVVYIAAVVVTDLPPSPAQERLLPAAQRVVDPWFAQQWTLFAPQPPTTNARLYLLVRYRPRSGLASPAPVDLTALYKQVAEQRRWAPPRLNRVTMDLAVEIDRVVLYLHPTTGSHPGSASKAEADVYFLPSTLGTQSPLSRKGAALLGTFVVVELQRLLSATATDVLPHANEIESVRGEETSQEIPPYQDRGQSEPEVTLFDTGWLPYVAQVAR